MVKFPYQRLAQMFSELHAESLPQEELARRLSVSTRTVRSDIDILNDILSGHGAQFVLKRGKGYSLNIDDPAKFEEAIKGTLDSAAPVPQSAAKRVRQLLIRFLSSAYALKLQDLADEWNVSRATLQADMADVRERFARYQLSIEVKPHYGMKLIGEETAIRVCLADLMSEISSESPDLTLFQDEHKLSAALAIVRAELPHCLSRAGLKLTDEGAQFMTFYCAIAVCRIMEGFPLQDFKAEEPVDDIRHAASHIIAMMRRMTGIHISASEEAFICVNIAARSVQGILPSEINADDAGALVSYILEYINRHYHYDLRHDEQLRTDMITHVKTMITRVRYQINLPNPVLADIKQHYALAFDFTLSAVSSWAKHSPYRISENEIGYLVLHIGVGLERHYQIGYLRRPQALLVNDGGNATLRTLEALLHRRFPQMDICATMTGQEYDQLEAVTADFVIATSRLQEKNRPVAVVSPFPSDYQIEQLEKLVSVDRTRPYMLKRYFAAKHFMVARKGMTQEELFSEVCAKLAAEGYVDKEFADSVRERESILSTMLGDGIAIPHALGLMARKTAVYTVIAPEGIEWGDGSIAKVIFLLAISKTEYEEAMAIYDLFVNFMRQRTATKLAESRSFEEFYETALASMSDA
ncbi:PRD domain-containing protein [Microvirga sp. W0021]|uniref:PRD domain-containing protein n=1 Tax=Hohaiivirga grylli TaxID=3133970 RepID=A0ABV0BGT9_9HYPH